MQRHLIIVAKRPLAGYAKTRLGAGIGSEQAAGVYARLLYQLLGEIAGGDLPGIAAELAVAAPADVPFFEGAFPEFLVRAQADGDMGDRLTASFGRAYDEGADAVVLVASDVPGLTARIVREAFGLLDRRCRQGLLAGVIGPTADGGYYLIGMRAPGAALFDGIAWSTSGVLAQTAALAAARHVALARLPELVDVDVRADYELWRRRLRKIGQWPSTDDPGGGVT